jgi:NADH-quinone oxidoreductase subunit I
MPRTKDEMLERVHAMEAKISKRKIIGPVYGLAKGMSITLKTMTRRAVTQQYPHVQPDLPPRTRGVIAFKEENCTVCMLCSRECPDWCIYIESHKDVVPPKTPGARARTRNQLDRFAIDFALCMYCGICVEVCPFDALFWSPHFEYSELDIESLTHEKDVLGGWMDLVMAPPELEEGAEAPPEAEAPMKAYEPAGVAAAAASAPAAARPAPAAAAVAPAPAATAPPAAAPDAAAPEAVAVEAPAGEAPAAEAAAPAAEAPAAAVDHGPPQIEEETYQRELAAGKPERVARALAKRAWVIKSRKGG